MSDPILKNPPDHIYLVPDVDLDYNRDSVASVTWSDEPNHDTDPQYVHADILAAVIAERNDARRRLEAWGQKAGADRALRVSELAMKYAGEMAGTMYVASFLISEDVIASIKTSATRLAEAMVPLTPGEQSATVADGGHNPGNPTPEHGRDAHPEPAGQADRMQHPGG